jgi:hypothetical protein
MDVVDQARHEALFEALSLLPRPEGSARCSAPNREALASGAVGSVVPDGLVELRAGCQRFAAFVGSQSWSAGDAEAGLVELELLMRSVDAVRLVWVAALNAGRDTAASLARSTGMAGVDARKLTSAAKVVAAVPQATELLAGGKVSAAHLATLADVNQDDAAALLAQAEGQSVDTFRRSVAKHQVEQHGAERDERQRKARYLRFFEGAYGSLGFSGQMTTVDGMKLKGMLETLAEARYRQDHPERARFANTTQTTTHGQRMADALVELVSSRQLDNELDILDIDDGCVVNGDHNCGDAQDTIGEHNGDPASSNGSVGDAIQVNGKPVNSRRLGDSGRSDDPRTSARTLARTSERRRKSGRERKAGRLGGSRDPWRPAVIVVVDLATLSAELVPGTPISQSEAAKLVAQAEVIAAVRDSLNPIRVNFGRSKRFATAMQRLLLAATFHQCAIDGCDRSALRAHAHHTTEFAEGGATDLADLLPLCEPHHAHLHLFGLYLIRSTSNPGKWIFSDTPPEPP